MHWWKGWKLWVHGSPITHIPPVSRVHIVPGRWWPGIIFPWVSRPTASPIPPLLSCLQTASGSTHLVNLSQNEKRIVAVLAMWWLSSECLLSCPNGIMLCNRWCFLISAVSNKREGVPAMALIINNLICINLLCWITSRFSSNHETALKWLKKCLPARLALSVSTWHSSYKLRVNIHTKVPKITWYWLQLWARHLASVSSSSCSHRTHLLLWNKNQKIIKTLDFYLQSFLSLFCPNFAYY